MTLSLTHRTHRANASYALNKLNLRLFNVFAIFNGNCAVQFSSVYALASLTRYMCEPGDDDERTTNDRIEMSVWRDAICSHNDNGLADMPNMMQTTQRYIYFTVHKIYKNEFTCVNNTIHIQIHKGRESRKDPAHRFPLPISSSTNFFCLLLF